MVARSAPSTPGTARHLFIVGPPRAGTTLLYRCLASHPDVAYLGRANRKWPHHPRLAHWLTRLGLYSAEPRESREVWDRYHAGFRRAPDDSMLASEVTDEIREHYASVVSGLLHAQGATHFVAKLPAHSVRIGWLDAVFPGALFLRALRDWRAVVSSTALKRTRDFPGHWFGVRTPGWRTLADLPPLEGAARSLLAVHDCLDHESATRSSQFLDVWYEDLCASPIDVMKRISQFAQLRWSDDVAARQPGTVRPASQSWKKHLSAQDVERLRETCGPALERHHYRG